MTRKLNSLLISLAVPFIAVAIVATTLAARAQVNPSRRSYSAPATQGTSRDTLTPEQRRVEAGGDTERAVANRTRKAGHAAGPLDIRAPLYYLAATYDSGGGGYGTSSVVIADVNGDGKWDLVVPNLFSKNVAVLLGNGDGTFQPAVTYGASGADDPSVAVADVNGDGKPDIILGLNGSVAVLLGNGDGTFQPAVTYGDGSVLANSIAVADLNHDGKPDVVVEGCLGCGGPSQDDTVAVLLGNGDGTFQPAVTYDPGGGEYIDGSLWEGMRSVAIADVNGDGKPDILVANLFDSCFPNCYHGSVAVLLGNGDGTFQPAVTNGSVGYYSDSLVVLDANGDGKPDLAVVNWGSGTVTLLLGSGDGTFSLKGNYDSGGAAWQPKSAAVADVNGDGRPDLVVADGGSGVGVLLGNGDGSFQAPAVIYTGHSYDSVAAADLTRRGLPDLVASSASYGTVEVLLHVGTISTTTTLISSLNPSVFWQTVSLTASVSSGDGIPTGTVVFYDGSTALGSVALVNGGGSISVSSLGAGSHSLNSVYQGSLKYNSSVSSSLNQVVNPATATTSLKSSPNPAPPGQKVTYVAKVSSQYAGAATGNVTFQDGGSTFATVALSNNQAKCSTSYQSFGVHSITATYLGDVNNSGSTSPPLSEYSEYPTSTVLTTSGSPSFVGQPVTFTATVSSIYGTIPPGELVTFYDGLTMLGSVTLVGGKATYTTSALKVDPHAIKATYPGDATFTPSSGTVKQVVTLYPTTMTLSTSQNPSNYGASVTLTAQVKITSSTAPTGIVTFKNGSTPLGLASVNTSGVATLNRTTLPVGSDSLTATYNGDAANAKSSSPAVIQTVDKAQITMKLSSSPNPSRQGQSVNLTAVLTSNGGLPNGQIVTFSCNGSPLGTGTISGGKATLWTKTLPVGSDVVTATYAGDANHSSAKASVTQTVD